MIFRTTTRRTYDKSAMTDERRLTTMEDRPLAAANRPYAENIQAILCKSTSLIETHHVQFTTHIHPIVQYH